MNNPVLYQSSNRWQRSDAKEVLNEFSNMWKWRPDGHDTLLDVGCGSGDVTIDFVLPILPVNFDRLVGCDLSNEMVNYARNNHIHPKVSFEQFDLGTDIELQSTLKAESFDHITSFYCLMWVHNQKMAIKNLYKLLKPGGDLLLIFLAQHPLYDFYMQQSQDDKWAKYMTDANDFISPYQFSKDPAKDFYNNLTDCGFTDCKVEAREKCFIFNGVEMTRNLLKSCNPFIDRIPIHDQSKYIEDLIQKFVQNKFVLDDFYENSQTCRFASVYKLMIAYARK